MNTEFTKTDRLVFLRRYVKLLESQFTFPGTNFKFGIDPIINLLPWIGSYSGLVLGFIFIFLAHRQGVSGKVKIIMFRNIFLDYIMGSIPIIGYFTDFVYKSNERNLKLLEEHISDDKHYGTGLGLIFGFLFICILLLIFSFIIFLWALKKLIELGFA